MNEDKNWLKFIKSGSVADYLQYVNSVKEKTLGDENSNALYDTRFSNKRDERRGE